MSNMTTLVSTAQNATLQNITSILEDSSSSNTTNTLPTGLEVYFMLLPSAFLGVIQRSITDEFESWLMAPANDSPFICAVNIHSTFLWMLNGWINNLDLFECAQLVVLKSGVSGNGRRRRIIKPQAWASGVLFLLSLYQAKQIFDLQHIFWEKVWIVLFNTSYLLNVIIDILASYAPTPGPTNNGDYTDEGEEEPFQRVFNVLDVLSIFAYVIQIKAWVDIYGKLVKVALTIYTEETVNLFIIGTFSIAVALSSLSPAEGKYKVLHGLWSLRNWNANHTTYVVVSGFIVFLMIYFLSKMWI
ncbi:hypothetical protein M7I_6881 [Glarea lozoyensis 74030]|uniref:Uncharacterized protein n=1 Tax=Glarea lozoyensis (strain ATCC 74030 / MF5533) TaxID=1104152 RepID=H0EVS6_GLAL7|nr:hypothetical protein M7I_6881 [Glarea lozoyensis 74030]